MKGPMGENKLGRGGFCVCVKCGFRKGHYPGVPCKEERCPRCGGGMLREGSEHHKMALEKRKTKENNKS